MKSARQSLRESLPLLAILCILGLACVIEDPEDNGGDQDSNSTTVDTGGGGDAGGGGEGGGDTGGGGEGGSDGEGGSNGEGAADCSSPVDFTDHRIEADRTIPAGCYNVSSTIDIRQGTTTIEPGTTFIFAQDAGLRVRTNGRLTADASSGAAIVFTAAESTPGFWRGVRFADSVSQNNILSNVVIEYGGSSDWGFGNGGPANLTLEGARIAISDITLQHSGGYGLWMRDAGTNPTFTGNTVITANAEAPVRTLPELVQFLNSEMSLTGNGDDYIETRGNDINNGGVWESFDVPLFVIDEIRIRQGFLQISAGNELIFHQGSGLRVDSDARLAVNGVAGSPVIFRGDEPIDGYWRGIRYSATNSLDNKLEHVEIRDGGERNWGFGNGGPANLTLDGARLSANNLSLSNSAGVGIYVRSTYNFDLDCATLQNQDGFNTENAPCAN